MARKERLKEVFDYVRDNYPVHTQADFADKIMYNRAYISSAMNGNEKYLTDKLFKNICEAFPNIFSLNYLLTGEGQLRIENDMPADGEQYDEELRPIRSTVNGKPYFNVDFEAGFDIMENDQTRTPEYLIDFAPYNNCDMWCNARGNSMYPTIASGDIVALKRVSDFSFLVNGEIYAIVTTNGLRTIKRVRDNGDTITLIPDNKEVAEQTIPKALLRAVFQIKGSFKCF
jgi:hypothetical protein